MSEPTQPSPSPAQAAAPRPSATALAAAALDRRVNLRALEGEGWELAEDGAHLATPLAHGARLLLYAMGAISVLGHDRIPAEAAARVERATGARVLPNTEESVAITLDPAAPSASVGWDRVVLPAGEPRALDAVALLLAQSAALERHEDAIEPLVEETADLARALAERGRAPWRRAPVRRIAAIAVQRLELARWFFVLDRPESTWESPVVDRLYDALFEHLELRERHAALEHKLSRIEHTLELVTTLWEGQRGRLLEIAILALIAVEIVLTLLGI